MFYVYVLRSKRDSKRYIGFTDDLARRFSEHNRGMVKSTRNRRPLELIYHEEFEEKAEAMHREEFFKTGQGRIYLNSLDK